MGIFLYQLGIFITIQIASSFGKNSRNTSIVLISIFTILQVFTSGLMVLQFCTIFISYLISENIFFDNKINKQKYYSEKIENRESSLNSNYIIEKQKKVHNINKQNINTSLIKEINQEYKTGKFKKVISKIEYYHNNYSPNFDTYSRLVFSYILLENFETAERIAKKSYSALNEIKLYYCLLCFIESYKDNDDLAEDYMKKAIVNGLTMSELENYSKELKSFSKNGWDDDDLLI